MTQSRTLHRHHFRAVIWFVVCLVLGQFALGYVVDQSSSEVRDPEYAAKRDRLVKWLEPFPGQPWILYLGSSRGAQGFVPRLLFPERIGFNFAIPGGGPMVQRVVYDRLKSEGIKPTQLLLEVMPIFFNGDAGDRVEMRLLDTARLQAQELHWLDESAADAHARYRRWVMARTVPEWRHDRELRNAIGLDVYRDEARPQAPEDAIAPDGWQPTHDPYYRKNQVQMHYLAHKQYDRFYPEFTPAHGPTLRLRQLIAQAQSDGIQVTLIVMPEATEFRDLVSDQHREAFGAFLTSLRNDFGVPLKDARDWIPDEEFFDGHHLFPEGGERFTLRLKQELP